MKTKKLSAEIFSDHRGTISTFYPSDPITEYNYLITKQGDERGYHYHPEFDEYLIVTKGKCLYREYSNNSVIETLLVPGDSVCIPKNTAHSFVAETDLEFISMLTKKWHDSNPPIVKVDKDGNTI